MRGSYPSQAQTWTLNHDGESGGWTPTMTRRCWPSQTHGWHRELRRRRRRGLSAHGTLANINHHRYALSVTNIVDMEVVMDTTALPTLLGYDDLARHGVTRHAFDRLLESGEFERISPGLFLRAGLTDDTTAAWIAIAAKKPDATLCLLTALSLHGLTDEIPTRSDIAIPRGTQPVAVHHAPIAWHRFDPDTFDMGRGRHELPSGLLIGLYSAERTLIDLFRLRHAWGSDLALGALKRWLRGRGNSPGALLAMAEGFPQARPAIHQALEVLL